MLLMMSTLSPCTVPSCPQWFSETWAPWSVVSVVAADVHSVTLHRLLHSAYYLLEPHATLVLLSSTLCAADAHIVTLHNLLACAFCVRSPRATGALWSVIVVIVADVHTVTLHNASMRHGPCGLSLTLLLLMSTLSPCTLTPCNMVPVVCR